MSLVLAIVFLSLNVERSGGAIKPVVTFTPNWGNIIYYDDVTLTCDVSSTVPEEPRTYHWYKDKRPIPGDQQKLHIIRSSVVEDRGDYQCQTIGGDISDPVFLNVTLTHVILQRPPSAIYEGDPLTLRCHHIRDFIAINTTFYKDDQEIKSSESDSTFHIPNITMSQSGLYKCTKQIHYNRTHMMERSDVSFISVTELFSPPEIKITAYWVIEGDEMTVRCDTRLDPLRGSTELHFAFYRDAWIVQEHNVSDTYRESSARLEDSGKFTCEVRTVSNTVRKMSDGLYIHIYSREVYVTVLAVGSLGVLLIIVLSAVLIWRCIHRKGSPASCQGSPQETATMVTDANPDPEDVCYTYLELSHLPKGNTIRNDGLTVTYATVKDPDI
ncbi:low affinity immunoglobulin gamma Fc region receptor III-A-like [Aquarana catesbeiana]|uniref:low affinity immunoglobulin gamma Fc region receptor III-A-like n=1 Tax=Aquarana catesbeiana TaxID=8400 RepID=UPI003CC9C6C0